MKKNAFDGFTRKYQLSKTLRFELKPVGKTRYWMNENLNYDKKLKTFLKDQSIENAYQALKPIFDKLHEEFITGSLESTEAKKINFDEYFNLYKKQKAEQNKEARKKFDKPLETEERELRKIFASLYQTEGEVFKRKAGKDKRGKEVLKEKGFKVLTEAGILKYIKNKIDDFKNLELKTRDGKEVVVADLKKALGDENTEGVFEKFFTYFGGFNQNRENYYSAEEKATAVASRIVNENLPKFCDNAIAFENSKNEYLGTFKFLENKSITLKDKDGNNLYPILEDLFNIKQFNRCLSQKQIDKYNEQIGNANFIVNLYNQQKSKDGSNFKKLPLFKILYKQIGCGEKNNFIAAIKDDNELKNILAQVNESGKKYFAGKNNKGEEIINVFDFADYVQNHENYKGMYLSDKALNTISSKYFANWFALKTKLKDSGVIGGKKRDPEDFVMPKAFELADLFEVLDAKIGRGEENENWKQEGVLFRTHLFEKGSEKKRGIIEKENKPSQALLAMIFSDVKESAEDFIKDAGSVLKITDYKKDENKQKIKNWLDKALRINQIFKYFKVKANKIKGEPIDAKIENGLNALVYSNDNPAKDYDNIRNYLTKKPQDGVMDNKLKLNFENSQLLGGWPDGQEKAKGAVLLRKDGIFYLGILKNKNIFDTKKKDNLIYKHVTENSGRMILINLAFKTLAGKGFKNLFGEKYTDMGKREPLKAIELLKHIIKDRYVVKYPMLQKILDTNYSEKKKFDSDIIEVLKEMYVCEFKSIGWKEIEKITDSGELYLFRIKSDKKKMQSLYWNHVFVGNSTIQLAGQGEIFYRKIAIKNKKTKDGYENKPWVIENKRFTEEKFLYHQSLKMNYKEKSYGKPVYAINEINANINNKLTDNKDVCFLGIDRGEKHLAYYSLVNQKGEIIKQGSFNEINGQNYNEKLENIAGKRDEARKSWQAIGTIKELKNGYISQVVRKIVDLTVENQAFIVLENLNIGFKRGRQKIEKQVYQKLELALAKKLNFLVDKNAKDGEMGSVTNALQLTPPVNNFGDIENRNQVGIMLYIKADYTSQTDPVTGWRKSIYLKKGSEEYIKKQIIDRFSEITFDGKDYVFEYKDANTGKLWKLYSGKNGESLSRFHRKKMGKEGQWEPKLVNIKENLDRLFADFDKTRSLYSQIVEERTELKKIDDHTTWETLRFTIEMIQQIRNTGKTKEDEDFILSPVRDECGIHFDSRKSKNNQPNCGDANGAYNIARKGIILSEHIKRNLKLFVCDEEWDTWLAGNDVWQKWLETNTSKLANNKNGDNIKN